MGVGCCPCRIATTNTSVSNDTTRRDSIYRVHHDTIYVVERDTVYHTKLPSQHHETTTKKLYSRLENAYCESVAKVDSIGLLTHTLSTLENAILPMRIVEVKRIHHDTIYMDSAKDNSHTSSSIQVVEAKTQWGKRLSAILCGVLFGFVIGRWGGNILRLIRNIF